MMWWFKGKVIALSLLVLLAMIAGCSVPVGQTPKPIPSPKRTLAPHETVTFPDANLDAAIREALGKPLGEEITAAKLAGLTTLCAGIPPSAARLQRPATLEAYIVRFADVISYVGRDFEDAVQVGIISQKKFPPDVKHILGLNNREIIRTIITDIIHNSRDNDAIILSDR